MRHHDTIRAHRLLDRAQAGDEVHERAITQALIDTGDLAPDALTQIRREAGTWEKHHVASMARAVWFESIV